MNKYVFERQQTQRTEVVARSEDEAREILFNYADDEWLPVSANEEVVVDVQRVPSSKQ